MKLKKLPFDWTVCKLPALSGRELRGDFFFVSKTDEELSLVCPTKDAPEHTLDRSDGWRGFRIEGVLDFSLVGVLSGLSAVLAEKGIGIFAVSTFNTDYILVKGEDWARAAEALEEAGHEVTE